MSEKFNYSTLFDSGLNKIKCFQKQQSTPFALCPRPLSKSRPDHNVCSTEQPHGLSCSLRWRLKCSPRVSHGLGEIATRKSYIFRMRVAHRELKSPQQAVVAPLWHHNISNSSSIRSCFYTHHIHSTNTYRDQPLNGLHIYCCFLHANSCQYRNFLTERQVKVVHRCINNH